ncbi:hypothetical protein [Nannocystis pusilla]|uniref:hypothetical protein n=1 Tax=Nannocystis pusilla TaxID=889268 RepID=UPI003DA63F6B
MATVKGNIAIGVSATTEGASAALGKTADATERMKTAAEAAGQTQAALAQAIDRAKKAVDGSTAANRRAKEAEEILSATIRKHGAASDQAKIAAERHARALEAATAAEKEAKVATEQMTMALAKASTVSDKGNSALARLTKQVEAVSAAAKKGGHDLAKLNLSDVGDKAGGAAGGFNLLGMAGGKLMAVLGPAALGATLVSFAGWVGEAAQATLQYETALANIPFSINNAQAATGGLVDKFALAKSAAQAVSLGIVKTEKDFNTLAEAATKIALRLGTDATQAIGDMTTALGRGSPEILDNLGVQIRLSDAHEKYAQKIGTTVKALTDEQKTLAFREAAMEALLKSANETTVAFDGNAAAVLRAKTELADLWSTIKDGTVNAVGAMIAPMYAANDQLSRMVGFAGELSAAGGPMELLAGRMTTYARETGGAANATLELLAAHVMTAEQIAQVHGTQDRERHTANAKRLAADRAAYVSAQEVERAQLAQTYAKRDAFWKERAAKDADEARKDAERKAGRSKKEKPVKQTDRSMTEGLDVEISDSLSASLIKKDELEIQRREEMISSLQLEMEARQAAGQSTEDLYVKQMQLERELLDVQRTTSIDRTNLERAETRYAKAQHQQRLRDLAATYAAEQKERELRQGRVQKVAGAVESFSSTMVDAMQAEAEGSKYAVAVSLESWLKGVRNQMIVTALKETALGVASAASYNYPAAAQHFAAAGLATGAAVAAGTGAVVVRGVTESRAGMSWDQIKGGGGSSGGSGGSNSGPVREQRDEDTARRREESKREGNERQEVPISWERHRRDNAETQQAPRMMESEGPIHVTVNVTGYVAGDAKEIGAALAKDIRKGGKLGKRY